MRTVLLSLRARAATLFRWLAGLLAGPLRRTLMWCALALPALLLVYTLVLSGSTNRFREQAGS